MKQSNKKSSVLTGILMFTVGGIFTAVGIAMLVIIIMGIIKVGISEIGVGILMPIAMIVALFGFGITALVMGGKNIYLWIRQSKTYSFGKETTACVKDYKFTSFSKSGNTRIRYALTLSYNDGVENKTFTTDYLFDVNEFRYLKKLKNVKVKIDGNFVTVCEHFPKDVYLIDSNYGIETAFFKKKPVAILLRLWAIFFFAALAFLIISFFIANSTVTQVAITIIYCVHFPFVIPLAIYMIRWMIRKK